MSLCPSSVCVSRSSRKPSIVAKSNQEGGGGFWSDKTDEIDTIERNENCGVMGACKKVWCSCYEVTYSFLRMKIASQQMNANYRVLVRGFSENKKSVHVPTPTCEIISTKRGPGWLSAV